MLASRRPVRPCRPRSAVAGGEASVARRRASRLPLACVGALLAALLAAPAAASEPPTPAPPPGPAGSPTAVPAAEPPPADEPAAAAAAPPAADPATTTLPDPAPAADPAAVAAIREEARAVRDALFKARARVSLVASKLFRARLTLRFEGNLERFYAAQSLTITVDGAPVYVRDAGLPPPRSELFELFAAPGSHELGVSVTLVSRRDATYRMQLDQAFTVVVPPDSAVATRLILRETGDMWRFTGRGKGRYRVRAELRARAKANKGGATSEPYTPAPSDPSPPPVATAPAPSAPPPAPAGAPAP